MSNTKGWVWHWNTTRSMIDSHQPLLKIIKIWQLWWNGHVSMHNIISNELLQGTLKGNGWAVSKTGNICPLTTSSMQARMQDSTPQPPSGQSIFHCCQLTNRHTYKHTQTHYHRRARGLMRSMICKSVSTDLINMMFKFLRIKMLIK